MPTPVDGLIELLVAFAFSILLQPSRATSTIRYALQNEAFLAGILGDVGLEFAPGLLDVIQHHSPPSIAWFEALDSAIPVRRRAIYILVLRKLG